jgi:hypothetical protein
MSIIKRLYERKRDDLPTKELDVLIENAEVLLASLVDKESNA